MDWEEEVRQALETQITKRIRNKPKTDTKSHIIRVFMINLVSNDE